MKNMIVGQSGGPTAVINGSLYGVVSEGFKHPESIEHVYGMINGIEGFLSNQIMDMHPLLKNGDLELIRTTPGSYLGSCRYKLPEDLNDPVYPELFQKFEDYNIGYFFYIGGNDSMDTVSKLSRYAAKIQSPIRVIGVPKTIDNDLVETDHTPGFGSAAKFVATTVREIAIDASVYDNKKSVTIVEIMGRHAGWLTAAAALAKGEDCEGVDMIYLPEKVFDIDKFMARVKSLSEQGRSMVIAISEGIKVADGRYVFELSDHVEFVDAFGHKQLAGSAKFLANKIGSELGIKTRAIELSTMQRCAAHMTSRTDITEAFNVGGAAVKAAFEGATGQVVVLKRISDDPYMCITETHDVHDIANVEKKIPLEWITDDDYVTDDLIHYIRPLIQAELSPIMVDGLPRHLNVNF